MIHELDLPMHSTARVASAAEIPATTLATRISRGSLTPPPLASDLADFRPGTGRVALYSTRRALQIALAEQLIRLGVNHAVGYRLALAFTDHNGNDGAAKAVLIESASETMRAPGFLYPDDTTVMRVFFSAKADEPTCSVDCLSDVEYPFQIDHSRFPAVLFVDLSDLKNRTLRALGLLSPAMFGGA